MISWEWLSQPGCERLVIVLIHFVWQGALIATGTALLVRFSSRRPEVRYGLLLSGMLLMAGSPVVTFWLADTGSTTSRRIAESPTVSNTAVAAVQTAAGNPSAARPIRGSSGRGSASALRQSATGMVGLSVRNESASKPGTLAAGLTAVRPWLLVVWFCGVLLLSVRLVLGYAAVRWLMRSREPVSRRLTQITRTMARRIGLPRVPIVAGCGRVADAMVVGFMRPMILLPAAWCTQLSPDVLEAVIAHELAHIRRWDLWVNLMQRFIETLLFYHPAIWWISRRLRAERELCCDTVAVAATGERLRYVEALATVASAGSHQTPRLLTAQMGGRRMALLNRVRHILGRTSREPHQGHWSMGALVLAIPLGLWLAAATMFPATAEEPPGPPEGRRDVRRPDRDRERPAPPRFRDRDRDGRPGDRPPREGDRPHGRRPEGDRPPRRGFGPRGDRDGDRDRRPRDGRPGEPPRPEDLIRLIQELREEVRALRHEVHELRGHRRGDVGRRAPGGERRFGPPEGAGPPGAGDRYSPPRRETDHDGERGPRRFGDRGPHPRPPFEGRARRGDRGPRGGRSRKRPPQRDGERDNPGPRDPARRGSTDGGGKPKSPGKS